MIDKKKYIVACNGMDVKVVDKDAKYVKLNHDKNDKESIPVKIKLLKFITSTNKLSDRKRDLLEIAGYVFAADRKCPRGSSENVEMHSWSREIEVNIKVRDLGFWQDENVKQKLNETLSFMTGDYSWIFKFKLHNGEDEVELFGDETFVMESSENTRVVLFSGGLDSLSGVIELLQTTNEQLCLVSHQSGNPSVALTQNKLFDEINSLYPNRCLHYKYECGLYGQQRADETQRTRSFVFNAIAYSLATTYGLNGNMLFENGTTSINLAETEDMKNSRASRTTHPKTLGLLTELFTMICEKDYNVENGFYDKTKADVVKVLKDYKKLKLLDIAVSCSATRNHRNNAKHCGVCSQCIDRRFAVYATEVEEWDENGTYDFDFVKGDLEKDSQKKALSDYLNQSREFKKYTIDKFHDKYLNEIIEMEEFVDGKSEVEKVEKIYNVCLRHGEQVENAIGRMSLKYNKAFDKFRPNSFFSLVLGMRSDENTIQPIKLTEEGKEKEEVPTRKLKELAAIAYKDILDRGIIDIKAEESKIDKKISNFVIPELEKKYKVKIKEKETLNDYFRQKRIEAKRKRDGSIEILTH